MEYEKAEEFYKSLISDDIKLTKVQKMKCFVRFYTSKS